MPFDGKRVVEDENQRINQVTECLKRAAEMLESNEDIVLSKHFLN